MLSSDGDVVSRVKSAVGGTMHQCKTLNMERLLIALRPMKRWPRLSRTVTISDNTLPALLAQLYDGIDCVDQSFCPMHTDDCMSQYQDLCTIELKRLGVSPTFRLVA